MLTCKFCGTPYELSDEEPHVTPLITPEAVLELKKRADAMAYWANLLRGEPDADDFREELHKATEEYRELVQS